MQPDIDNTIKVQIGKNGVTEGTVKEIKKHLKAKKAVKVKFLKAFIKDKDRKAVSADLEEKLEMKGQLIGNVLTLKK